MSRVPLQDEGPHRRLVTRGLVSASRNALTRIELAASQLARVVQAPRSAEWVDVVRGAVSELDGLLESIRGLAQEPETDRPATTDAVPVVERVRQRLQPTLAARGVVLPRRETQETLAIGVPEPALERIVLALVRLSLEGAARGTRLELVVARDADGPRLEARRADPREAPVPATPAGSEAELSAELARWGGRLCADATGVGWQAHLPGAGGHA